MSRLEVPKTFNAGSVAWLGLEPAPPRIITVEKKASLPEKRLETIQEEGDIFVTSKGPRIEFSQRRPYTVVAN